MRKSPKDLRLPPIKKRERPFEYRLREALAKRGVLFIKIKPTISGLPDRAALGYNVVKLVELKRDDENLEAHQQAMRAMLKRKHGVDVLVLSGTNVEHAARRVILFLRGEL